MRDPADSRSQPIPSVHLAFLDGLRGLAALYVLLHHASLMVPPDRLSGPASAARFVFRHGHAAVGVFIVLSGFCLMRPVATDALGRLRGGFWSYLARRARRILPPYYAALAVCVLGISIIPALGVPSRSRWDRALPVDGPGNVLAHLLLVHNFDEGWIYKIDPPLWSVATEWQIYLLFPLFLAVWRRLGVAATVASGFALGYGVAALSVPAHSLALRWLCPWYAGLFTLGMAAACSGPTPCSLGSRSLPRALATAGLIVAAVATGTLVLSQYQDQNIVVSDFLVGAAAACLIARWARVAGRAGPRSRLPVLRLLEARWTVSLGAFSYSLYLTHYPVLALGDAWSRIMGLGPDLRLGLLIGVGSPVCLLVARLFYAAFERPFTSLAGVPASVRGPWRVGGARLSGPERPPRRIWLNVPRAVRAD